MIKWVLKPIISPKFALKRVNEIETFIIENSNAKGDIYYTLDGTTQTSRLYEGSIELNGEMTIKAKVFIEGVKDSLEDESYRYQSRLIQNIMAITKPVEKKI